jgi:hypothetical protein
MQSLPEKTCSIDRLIRSPRLVKSAIDGQKTQQRRDGVYGYPGEIFELEGVGFIITNLERQRLGDMVDQDAISEGYPNMGAYREIILKMHSGMTWNDNGLVWVHTFKKSNP